MLLRHDCLRIPICITGSLLLLGVPSVQAQWTDKVTTTPSLIQTDFGPYGEFLPDDGGEYCVPTSTSMAMLWLELNGYSQLAASSVGGTGTAYADYLMVEAVSGMMQTTSTGGTSSAGADSGIQNFLNAKGLQGQYTFSTQNAPDLDWYQTNLENQSVALVNLGWYKQIESSGDYVRSGGHDVLGLAVDISGSTITVNNPSPLALTYAPNIPSSNPQTASFQPVGSLPLDPAIPGSPNMLVTVKHSADSGSLAVVERGTTWTIDADAMPGNAGYTPSDWSLTEDTVVSAGNGFFDVLVPIVSTTQTLTKQASGTVIFTQDSPSLAGSVGVFAGTLQTSATGGTPFGTGSLTINQGELRFAPDDSTPGDLSYSVASGSGNQITISNGSSLSYERGSNTSLSVTLGGNTDGTTANLVRENAGTIVLNVTSPNALGDVEKIIVNGSGSNLPAVFNGFVEPWMVGHGAAAADSFFLSYDSTDGFIPAVMTDSSTVNINSATATDGYRLSTDQMVNAGETATVNVLEISNGSTLSAGAGGSLQVGSQGANGITSVIMNGGGTLAAPTTFGASEVIVHAGGINGRIEAPMSGSGRLSFAGAGQVIAAVDSNLSGEIVIQSGASVVVENAGGSAALGTGELYVNRNALLSISATGTLANAIAVNDFGKLSMAGGVLNGDLNVGANGVFHGFGQVNGVATFSGALVEAGPIGLTTFSSNAEFRTDATTGIQTILYFRLAGLTDSTMDPSGFGQFWNGYEFEAQAMLKDVIYLVEFDSIADPNSGDPFWDLAHSWLVMEFNDEESNEFKGEVGNSNRFAQGLFNYTTDTDGVYLNYTPVPEPAVTALALGAGVSLLLLRRRSRKL